MGSDRLGSLPVTAAGGPENREARYRVEHHRPCRIRVLAVLSDAKPTVRSLDPFRSRLLLAGETGWLVLVDDTTGHVVVRRRIV